MQSVNLFQDDHSQHDYSVIQQEKIKEFEKLVGSAMSAGDGKTKGRMGRK